MLLGRKVSCSYIHSDEERVSAQVPGIGRFSPKDSGWFHYGYHYHDGSVGYYGEYLELERSWMGVARPRGRVQVEAIFLAELCGGFGYRETHCSERHDQGETLDLFFINIHKFLPY